MYAPADRPLVRAAPMVHSAHGDHRCGHGRPVNGAYLQPRSGNAMHVCMRMCVCVLCLFVISQECILYAAHGQGIAACSNCSYQRAHLYVAFGAVTKRYARTQDFAG